MKEKLKKLEELMDESIMIFKSLADDFMKEGDFENLSSFIVLMKYFNTLKESFENMKLEETGENEDEK